MKTEILQQVRKNNPLIHHITNQVVMNFTANGLLAFGGSPIMAKAKEEVHEMSSHADGLLLNIGTMIAGELPAMIIAGQAANDAGIPVVLDPVGVAATPFRTNAVNEILEKVNITAIKGNAGELAHLVDIPWETKGVESLDDGDTKDIAQKVSEVYETTAIITGEIDVISSKGILLENRSGHPILSKITGAGCLLGSILTACLTTDHSIEDQALTALHLYGLAAEYAIVNEQVSGPGTFIPHFIDALSYDLKTLERT